MHKIIRLLSVILFMNAGWCTEGIQIYKDFYNETVQVETVVRQLDVKLQSIVSQYETCNKMNGVLDKSPDKNREDLLETLKIIRASSEEVEYLIYFSLGIEDDRHKYEVRGNIVREWYLLNGPKLKEIFDDYDFNYAEMDESLRGRLRSILISLREVGIVYSR